MSEPFTFDNPLTGEQDFPQLSVTYQNIPDTDSNALYAAPSSDSLIFTDYIVENKIVERPHVYMLPICGDVASGEDTCAFVQLARPTLTYVVDWTAMRMDRQPTIPDPLAVSGDWVFLGKEAETRNVDVMGDGSTEMYRISGTYYYGRKKFDQEAMNYLRYGQPPYLENVPDLAFDPQSFSPVISPPGDGAGYQE
jgi:hypothetical protein